MVLLHKENKYDISKQPDMVLNAVDNVMLQTSCTLLGTVKYSAIQPQYTVISSNS